MLCFFLYFLWRELINVNSISFIENYSNIFNDNIHIQYTHLKHLVINIYIALLFEITKIALEMHH